MGWVDPEVVVVVTGSLIKSEKNAAITYSKTTGFDSFLRWLVWLVVVVVVVSSVYCWLIVGVGTGKVNLKADNVIGRVEPIFVFLHKHLYGGVNSSKTVAMAV